MKQKIYNTLKKGKSNNRSDADWKSMLSAFHQPEYEFEVKDVLFEDISKEPDLIEPPADLSSLFNKIWNKIEREKKQSKNNLRYLTNFFKLTAAVVIGLLLGIFVSLFKNTDNEPIYYSAYSPKGSISEMILPDGSLIFLNAGSKIKYTFEGKDGIREVFLEGEAWFDVEKDVRKPFIVHTNLYDVKVTGTQFNIKAYNDDNILATTLETGQIIIKSTEQLKLAKSIIMHPGEQVILDKQSKKLSIINVNTRWFTSWKDNKLIFVNMHLKDLVRLLERKYGVDIDIQNKKILNLHFDGTIKDESIIEFLEIVKKTLPINYKIIGQKILITDSN